MSYTCTIMGVLNLRAEKENFQFSTAMICGPNLSPIMYRIMTFFIRFDPQNFVHVMH